MKRPLLSKSTATTVRSTSLAGPGGAQAAPALATLITPALSTTPNEVTQLYAKLKDIENQTNFPLPTPTATVNVGIFNAATNKFDGLVTEFLEHIKPKALRITPVADVNGVTVKLIFEVVNHKAAVTFIVNGIPHLVPVSKKSVTADVGQATEVRWLVKSGNLIRYRDELKLVRPPVIGAGAFTVPALPVALVYEPPQGQLKKNSARYIKIRSEGTTVRLSFSSEDSTTRPTDSEFADIQTVKSALGLAATGLEKVNKGVAAGLKLLASGLGEASASLTTGTSVTRDSTLAVRNTVAGGFTTAAREGPGAGDVLIYLRNARLVWLAQNSRVRLVFIGAEGQVSATVKDLKGELAGLPLPTSRSARFGLDRATIAALLATDPFVSGGPKATLAAERFRYVETFELHGNLAFDYEFDFAVEKTDLAGQTSFTVRSEDLRKGFLSFIGIGVSETKSTKTVTKYGSSTETQAGEEIRVSGHFETQGGEDFAVTAFYDRAFGTLAFAPVSLGPEQVEGVVTGINGKPVPRQPVTLVTGGRKVTTNTDALGRYSFRSAVIGKGPATLIAGATRRNVTIADAAVRGVELKQVK